MNSEVNGDLSREGRVSQILWGIVVSWLASLACHPEEQLQQGKERDLRCDYLEQGSVKEKQKRKKKKGKEKKKKKEKRKIKEKEKEKENKKKKKEKKRKKKKKKVKSFTSVSCQALGLRSWELYY
ncbi:unnamed protein product [Bubo scandiacus]